MFVRKVKDEPAIMLSNTDIHGALWGIELRAGFKQVERGRNDDRARSGPGSLVIASAYPVSEAFATKGPSFAVAVRYEVGERDPSGSVK
jgi:hypothetical protein